MNNGLEDFIRNEMKGFKPVPSEDLWSRIEAELPEKKRKQGGWLLMGCLFVLSILVVLVAFYSIHYFNEEIDSMNEILIEQSQQIDLIKQEYANNIGEERLESDIEISPPVYNSKSAQLKSEPKMSYIQDQLIDSYLIESQNVLSKEVVAEMSNVQIENDINQSSLDNTASPLPQNKSSINNHSLVTIELITSLINPLLIEKKNLPKLTPVTIAIPKKNSDLSKFAISIMAGRLNQFTKDEIDFFEPEPFQTNTSIFKPLPYKGFAIGLGLLHSLNNRWSIEAGLSYAVFEMSFDNQIEVFFDWDIIPVARPGETFDFQQNIVGGERPAGVNFSAKRSVGSSNVPEQIVLDIVGKESFKVLSLPVLLHYALIDKQFKWRLSAGMQFRKRFDDNFTVQDLRPSEDAMLEIIAFDNSVELLDGYSPINLDFKIGSNISYPISHKWDIRAQIDYSINKKKLSSIPLIESTNSSIGMSVGIMYKI